MNDTLRSRGPGRTAPPAPPGLLGRRQYAWLGLAFVVLACYGSLVPFAYQPVPFPEAVERFGQAFARPVRIVSRSDWAANFLLLLPPAYLFVAALAVDRPWRAGVLAALVVVPGCGALGTLIEFVQVYFPPRVPSLNDVVAQLLGALAGAGLWLAAGQRLTDWLRHLGHVRGTHEAPLQYLLAYCAVLLVTHAVPFDLTISPADLYHKLRDGRVVLLPFTATMANGWERAQKVLLEAAYFLPTGLLLAGLPGARWQTPRSWPLVLAGGIGLAGLVEFLQVFVESRFADVTDVLIGSLAVLLGWRLSVLARRSPAASPGSRGWLVAAGLFGWVAVLVFVSWQPFAFAAAGAGERLRAVTWFPFLDYQRGNYLHAFDQIVHKTVLFVPLGALLALCRGGANVRQEARLVVACAISLAAVLEAGQLFLPTRYTSVTDVVLAGVGAWLGVHLLRGQRDPHGLPQRPPGLPGA